MIRYFPAVVERGCDGFDVFFPDVLGCTSAGATIEDAVRHAEEALQGHLDLCTEHGDPVPDPSDLQTIGTDQDVDEAARVLVRAETGGKAVRVNITLPEELLAAVDRYAKRTGFTRSGLLAQAVRARIRGDRDAA